MLQASCCSRLCCCRPPRHAASSWSELGAGADLNANLHPHLNQARGIELVAQRAALAEAARTDALRRGLIGEEEGARLELLHADATQPGVLQGLQPCNPAPLRT